MITPKAINAFTGEHAFLSNFFIEPDGTHVEGEYQAAKCLRPDDAIRIVRMLPPAAKKAGRHVQLIDGWDEMRLEVMARLVHKKFQDHPKLALQLKRTGTAELVGGNWWGDTFWGMSHGEGANHLGKILMQVRAKL